MRIRISLLSILAWITLLACGQPQAVDAAAADVKSDFSPSFSPKELASDVRPQDDFWGFVNGKWLADTQIPGDRSSYGTFHEITDATEANSRAILETALKESEPEERARMIGDLYGSFLDEDAIRAVGLKPLQPLIEKIEEIDSYHKLERTFGAMAVLGVTTPVAVFTDNDAFDATKRMMYLWQGGIGLPDRSYYLSDNPKLITAREAYRAHVKAMFEIVGWLDGEAAAEAVLKIETGIAGLQWTRLQNRDRQKIYSNQHTFEEANRSAPDLDLLAWFAGFQADPPERLVVGQDSYFAGIGTLIRKTPLAQWHLYLKFHVLKMLAPYLTEDVVALDFDFQGRELRGKTEQAQRWRRGVRFVNQNAGELLGQLYVQQYFDQNAKVEIGQLVENLRKAFGISIQELEWMSDETKQEALQKLGQFIPRLGYPDEWRDFSKLTTQRTDLVGNVLRAKQFAHAYQLELLRQEVDKNQWTIYPHMVNAFYRPTHNSITFPAGILQPPMFQSGRDPAMNYGAIGAVIGHEFSHGFDDQGRKFDGAGMLRNWWSDEDVAQYQSRAEVLVAQYNAFQPLPDTSVDGELTLGENIGDLAGLLMAYRAFELSGHADGPDIAGYSPRQRFFISYAIAWRNKIRAQYLRELLLRDTHAPAQYRVTGILRNMPEFYRAFDVTEKDGMYLSPTQRAKIW